MNSNELKKQWKNEEYHSFKGWDFSYLNGRWANEELPWDYRATILSYIKESDRLLDMGTGDGKFLHTINHASNLTYVTEAYPPNVELCKKELEPLGITVAQVYDDDKLPFENETFDIVINRHESFDGSEVHRVLKNGGFFITQQVGGRNDNDLSFRLIKSFVPQFPEHTLNNNIAKLKSTGFDIIKASEAFPPIRFCDIGALVYFAKIIEWEFPDFSVESCFNRLCECQRELDKKGYVEGTEHRFIIIAKKK